MRDDLLFRTWDKKYLCYRNMAISGEGVLLDHGVNCVAQRIDGAERDRYIVEKCTGIKDKKGELIYEGDLLKWESGEVCRVTYNTREARFDFGENECLIAEFAEVIGNTHVGKH